MSLLLSLVAECWQGLELSGVVTSVHLPLQKKDPAQFLQVHGRACKVHLDSAVALAAESPVNM